MAERLEDAHLADLHELAAERGVPGYRRLRREQLIAEIEARGDAEEEPEVEAEDVDEPEPDDPYDEEEPDAGGAEPEPDDPYEEEEPEAGEAEPEPDSDEVVVEGALVTDEADEAVEVDAGGVREPDADTEEVDGVLELMPQRFGFLRLHGLEPSDDDVYISASQVRRCELRSGDEVTGPAREPRRGERHRALVHVDLVNGEEPLEADRPDFDALPPVAPEQRVPPGADFLARAVDLLAPLALGQRVLVRSAPRSGRTTLLRSFADVAAAADLELILLLIDERPEEATGWRERLSDTNAELAIATSDMPPRDQVGLAELALERGRRRAETGADVVLIVDSLSRLAQAAGGVGAVKHLFGSGRNLAGGGSLTVVGTVLAGAADEGEAERAVITTENATITLDPELAAAGLTPPLRAAECWVSNEEQLRDPSELEAVRGLRSLLADLPPREAANLLRERVEGTATNAELLGSLG
jgi:transcription termination factor Rho